MRLKMEQRSAVEARTAGRYKQAGKKGKGLILAEFIKLTEYALAYARHVLRKHGQRIRVGQQTVLVADAKKKLPKNKRPRVYDEKVVALLIQDLEDHGSRSGRSWIISAASGCNR